MKVTIDFNQKTIQILEEVTLKELLNWMMEFFEVTLDEEGTKIDTKDWKISPSPITYYTYPWTPATPVHPWDPNSPIYTTSSSGAPKAEE